MNKTSVDIYIEKLFGKLDYKRAFIKINSISKERLLYIPVGNKYKLYKVIPLSPENNEKDNTNTNNTTINNTP